MSKIKPNILDSNKPDIVSIRQSTGSFEIENENENENEINSKNENIPLIKILRVSENYPASIRYIEKLLHTRQENISIYELINSM